jgi:hypothetical protein
MAVSPWEKSSRWWTRSQRIRTEGKIPFEITLIDSAAVPAYITIAAKALLLAELNMTDS